MAKIRDVTRRAILKLEANSNDTNKPIKILQKLEGIPMQMSTFILSMFDLDRLPFFSDELNRYIHLEEAKNEGRHADKNVPHSMKEYNQIWEKA